MAEMPVAGSSWAGPEPLRQHSRCAACSCAERKSRLTAALLNKNNISSQVLGEGRSDSFPRHS